MSIRCEARAHVLVVTIDRPDKRNAMTRQMLDELAATWEQADADDAVRAVVLTGAGGTFSSGADLLEDWTGSPPSLDAFFPERVLRKPLLAAASGYCLAGGCELLLACDIRVAAPDTTFGLPEATRGLFPGGGTAVRAPRRLGWPHAMQLLMTGEPIDADTALRIGLINEIAADPLARAIEIAERIAANSPASVRAIKECALATDGLPLLEAFDEGARFVKPGSADIAEGIQAWQERRPPQF